MVYRYISSKPFYYQSDLLIGVEFRSDWLTIMRDGNLIIPEHYAWDGCTPSFYLGFWFGTPPLIYLPMCGNNAGKNYGTGGDFTVNSGPFAGARGAE